MHSGRATVDTIIVIESSGFSRCDRGRVPWLGGLDAHDR
jgi:hypothetical protein